MPPLPSRQAFHLLLIVFRPSLKVCASLSMLPESPVPIQNLAFCTFTRLGLGLSNTISICVRQCLTLPFKIRSELRSRKSALNTADSMPIAGFESTASLLRPICHSRRYGLSRRIHSRAVASLPLMNLFLRAIFTVEANFFLCHFGARLCGRTKCHSCVGPEQ